MTTDSPAASVLALGLMSGTSMDGVDVAAVETDGEACVVRGASSFRPYSAEERALLRRALVDAVGLEDRSGRPGALAEAESMITRAHAEAVEAFLAVSGTDRTSVAVVGFHGQTVLHRPEKRLTVQIGDGPELARRLGLTVVYDLRAADVAAGGQGAPLVPVYHRALAEAAVRSGLLPAAPLAILNLGGVGNVTLLAPGADPVACDTGPGNALLDDLMLERTGTGIDRDGATAARGTVHEPLVARFLAHAFFEEKPPKSLDRNAFDRSIIGDLPTDDAAATVTALTAASVARLVPHLAARPVVWVVCGGGARNPTMMRMLAERLGTTVIDADTLGWSADAMEAEAFAYLAVRSLRGLPLSFPGTTGVRVPTKGGVIARGE
jgi:anhydro-N-acetylmuramic acid kinase